MSTTSPSPRRPEPGSARPLLLLFLAVLIFIAGGATTWWWLERQRPSTHADYSALTPPSAAPSPEALPSAAAPGETAPSSAPPTSVAAAAPEAGGGTLPAHPAARRPVKPVPPPPNQLAQLLSQADGAASEKRYSDAALLYDRALKLDPRSEAARAGKARLAGIAPARSFVLGTTVVESLRAIGHELDGFETSGVGVKRAPKVDGQLELVMDPPRVKPGEPYAVKVFLKNDGKKPIDVEEMKVSMIVDGKWSTRPLPTKVKQVAPQQRVLLEELPGVWKSGVADWAVEAVVTSKVQDVYRNRLTWK